MNWSEKLCLLLEEKRKFIISYEYLENEWGGYEVSNIWFLILTLNFRIYKDVDEIWPMVFSDKMVEQRLVQTFPAVDFVKHQSDSNKSESWNDSEFDWFPIEKTVITDQLGVENHSVNNRVDFEVNGESEQNRWDRESDKLLNPNL